ncbi:thiamine diphosphokinase [Paracoccus aestuariivivens]|uniref:Thiamine diphosphokinase n=1 Tax=Paracoccus aestuariivivens TaxID=1820333 RepID=A0A6L6J706_9RHOB|nr:thiamine diphosphokinase [Paracoccus aestuariivivens]MTH76417.1 thiamine diphosphokinase [Paracoccus aestuariivivens]
MTAFESRLPVTLIGGGTVSQDDLDVARGFAPVIAAADGGADHALASGLLPEAVFGDFDSLSDHALATIPRDRLHHIPEQDSTDFEKCLSRIDAPFVLAVGFGGTRYDHFLAALNVLVRRVGPPCILIAGDDVIVPAPPSIALDLAAGTRLSLFPMGPARGRSRGLKWPIDGLDFAPDGRIGTSNEVLGRVELELDGQILLILPRSCLGDLIASF